MFPNPQDALPLPPRPSLDHYKGLAKGLLEAARSRDIHQADSRLEEFARRELTGRPSLAKAQFVIARSHGFESWPKFARHLAALSRSTSAVSRFEAAADAIVTGDIPTLRRLLSEDPKLARARSTREHAAALLHYVSANGVENYRQKTPRNIAQLAELLLHAGAEIDATANVYGGGCAALELVATSVHPERAGVQQQLLQTLLDHGASLEKPSLVTACLANNRPQAAEFLANRGAPVDFAAAAGLGRLAAVRALFEQATAEQLRDGLLYACAYGHASVVQFLLGKGVDPIAHCGNGQTALHCAVIGGHPGAVQLLLRHGVPLEVKNRYGGTPLGQALWSAAHAADPDVYIEILNALATAGANIPERHVPVNPPIDAWLAAHGSSAEPAWHWHGE